MCITIEFLKLNTPFVAGCQEPIAEWRIPNMRGIMSARTKPLKVVAVTDVENYSTLLGYQLPPAKQGVKLVSADNAAELVTLLKEEARII